MEQPPPADASLDDDDEDLSPPEVLRNAGEQLLSHAAKLRVTAAGAPSVEDRLLALCARIGRVEYLRSDHESMLEYEREPLDEPGREDREERWRAFNLWCVEQLTGCAVLALQLAVTVYVTVAAEWQPRPEIIAEMREELMSQLAMEADSLTRWGALDPGWRDVAHELHIRMGSVAAAVAQAAYEWQEGRFAGEAGLRGVEIAAETLAHAARIADACEYHDWPVADNEASSW